ncbi:MAG: hypothetical protein Q4E10_03610 [Porphyromonas sp.]|nr:hypothetical protein [Porphyromonas sp.]
MDNKIQELAEKIYNDGVKKANTEAEELIAKAEAGSKEILNKARAEADRIVANATQEADRLRSQSETDVKNMVNAAQDALLLKVTNLVNGAAVQAAVDEAFAKPEALYNVVVEMAKALFANENKGMEIATSDAKPLEEYFRAKAKEVLDHGVKIREVAGKSADFDISPEGADYKINVSKEAFARYFTEFMRPRMREILFAKDQSAE